MLSNKQKIDIRRTLKGGISCYGMAAALNWMGFIPEPVSQIPFLEPFVAAAGMGIGYLSAQFAKPAADKKFGLPLTAGLAAFAHGAAEWGIGTAVLSSAYNYFSYGVIMPEYGLSTMIGTMGGFMRANFAPYFYGIDIFKISETDMIHEKKAQQGLKR